MRRLFLYVAAVSMVATLSACASPADPAKMVPTTIPAFAPDSPLRGAIFAVVGGGEQTDLALVSKVDDAALGEALRRTLRAGSLLADDRDRAPWRLDVFLVELKFPGSGFTTTVDSFVRYTLTRAADGTTAFDDIVTSSFTVTVGEVYVGVERLKAANEGSIKANITEFLRRIHGADVGALPTGSRDQETPR